MKNFSATVLLTILVVGIGSWAFSDETHFDDLRKFDRSLPAWKFGRGVVNILSGPHELFASMTNNAISGAYNGAYGGGFHGYIAGSLNGFIGGTGPGLVKMLRRMSTGCLEVLTFWRCEYGPTVDPPYGTISRAFPNLDYFDKEPFWYSGPAR